MGVRNGGPIRLVAVYHVGKGCVAVHARLQAAGACQLRMGFGKGQLVECTHVCGVGEDGRVVHGQFQRAGCHNAV